MIHRLRLGMVPLVLFAVFIHCTHDPPPVFEPDHTLLDANFRANNAFGLITYLSERWRLRGGGNRGFDASVDHLFDYLQSSEFREIGTLSILEGPLTLHPLAWEPIDAEIAIVSPVHEVLHTYADTPSLLGKYSGATPDQGIEAELVDVGSGVSESDYADKQVRGKIVLAHGMADQVFALAVKKFGALGIVSDRVRRPELAARFPEMVLYEALPFTTPQRMLERRAWLLKVSPKNGARLRQWLASTSVCLQVRVRTKFFESQQRILVAEIPGTRFPDQRVVLISHIDNNKPGANNNASGVAAHAELARTIAALIARKKLTRPARTLTFLFGAEREGTRLWLDSLGAASQQIIAVLNADMAGENTALTGGTYRLEKSPEPTMAVQRHEKYTIDEDRHSGWGFRPIAIDPYPGTYLNSLVWDAVCYRSAKNGWQVMQHAFEGGSDHDVTLLRGLPTTLSWHWEDYFIGTNLDTPDKVSTEELKNVAVVHGMVALLIARGRSAAAEAVFEALEKRAIRRLETESQTARTVLMDWQDGRSPEQANFSGRDALLARELDLYHRWLRWYQDAFDALLSLPVDGKHELLQQRIIAAKEMLALQREAFLQEFIRQN